MPWESRKQNVLSVSNYVKTKFARCLVAKTDSLVAKRNAACFKVIHIWLGKEVLWIGVIKVFSNKSPQSGIKGQVGKRFWWPLVVHGRNPSTRQSGEKHDSNLEVILLYIFLRFCWHWITSYVTNFLGSTLLMQMQRNAMGWYYYRFYYLCYIWRSVAVRIQINNKEKQIQMIHSWRLTPL